jgi:hypothetical protein
MINRRVLTFCNQAEEFDSPLGLFSGAGRFSA